MKKLALIVLITLVLPAALLAWGNATHGYFAHRLGAAQPPADAAEIYASVLPDMCNLVLDAQGQFLADRMHQDVESLVLAAHGTRMTWLAYGFASHSDSWAADFTAHHDGRTTPGTGYIIAKGNIIAPLVIPDVTSILVAGGLDAGTAGYLASVLAPALGHDLAETAVDLLVQSNDDPGAGPRLAEAANRRPAATSTLLVSAYARQLSSFAGISIGKATQFIRTTEEEYRQMMIQYGLALSLSTPAAIQALAGQSAAVAEMYLEAYAGVDVSVDPALVASFIGTAMTVVAPDYQQELALSESFIAQALQTHGVPPGAPPFGKAGEEVPLAYGLTGNYPNPFNPVTALSFNLSAAAPVTLEVYNVIGQRMRTLLSSEFREAGESLIMWDGKDDSGLGVPSGTYIARLSSREGVSMLKMMMVK